MKQLLKHCAKKLPMALSSLALAACSTDYLPSKEFIEAKLNIFETQEIVCPNLRILRAGETFVTPTTENVNNQSLKVAEIGTVQASCRIEFPNQKDATSFTKFAVLTTELDIYITLMNFTENHQNTARSLPYFVALVNRFGKIATKQVFQTNPEAMRLDSGTDGLIHEKVIVSIPIDDLSEAEGYEMLVGFQLSKVQVEDFQQRDR